MPHPVTWNYKL